MIIESFIDIVIKYGWYWL